ncbi:hypothetical protein Ae201684P_011856 [Aphanomyces euteiches]|uniref:Pentacotripeptide-repeat region of PRORP domain-containing protein n=1 Tax=Aphanomyces euteiches TaxID=100861 RepID=A0A6G0WUU5_9STRA|nr:hypothetical protein Ae201684_011495 [Aphanomyces euteiches]KAH9097130.1 hypothetical protein Ae201684P_011856 [Aphanomyces euteiches]
MITHSAERMAASLSESSISALLDKSITSKKRLELVETYFAQRPQSVDEQDKEAISIMLNDLLLSREMASALAMIELMKTHNVTASKDVVMVFARMFARLMAEDKSSKSLSDQLKWYLEHQSVFDNTELPLDEMFVELVTRGHFDVAIELWQVCMEPIADLKVAHHASVHVLLNELNRFQQYGKVIDLFFGPHKDLLITNKRVILIIMDALVRQRDYDQVQSLHSLLEEKRRVPDNPKLYTMYSMYLQKARDGVDSEE